MVKKDRAWFIDEDGRAPLTLYIMYNNALNPTMVFFKRGKFCDLSGFRYELAPHYDKEKLDRDYLYKAGEKIVKFHAANTDSSQDQEIKNWNITSTILHAIKDGYKNIILINQEILHEPYLLEKSSNPAEIKALKFNVEKNKWADIDYIKTWDFLPNSIGVPLANKKALEVLEEVCSGQFQAIPSEIIMPDGYIIKEYKLINMTNVVDSVEYSKSKPTSSKYRLDWDPYDIYAHKQYCLGKLDIATSKELVFLGSTRLKSAIKGNHLKGIVFKDKIARHYFLEDDA